jgi:sugar lactone lactonase YvrE
MGSMFGRAVVVAGAVVMALGSAAGAAAAKPGPPVLAFSPAPYDYGQVAAGGAASQTFTLANTGGQATGRLAVTLTGAAAFTITGSTCHPPRLRPGGACTITVRFAPSRAGRITATLTAASKGGPQHAATAADVLTGGRALGAAPGQIYWVSQDEIWAANLDGTSPHAILTGQDGPAGIAVNSSHLYWADGGDGTIWEANLDGTSPHIIFTGQRGLAGLAVTPSHIFWANEGGAGDRAGTIWAADLDGSNPHTIVTGQTFPDGVAADASHVYWSDEGLNEQPGNGTISEANPDGTSPHTIATGLTTPIGVAVDASHLYWASSGDGTVTQASLDGTSPHTIATGQNGPYGVASDASHLYWVNKDGGTVTQASPDGTSPHTIVTGQVSPTWMAVTPAAAPALSFTPAPFGYGQVGTGQAVSQTFTLANTGGQATGALTGTLTGAAAFTITGDTCAGTSLAAGATCTVTVRFAPASSAPDTATLTAASVNPAVIATDMLTGTGVAHPRFLYWTDSGDGTIKEIPLTDTGTPTTLVTGQPSPAGVAVDASHIYWATGATPGLQATIKDAPLTGSPLPAILIGTGLVSPAGVAVDATHIYWADSGDGTVDERKLSGGLTIPVFGQAGDPAGVAVDSTHLYWADSGLNTVNEARLTSIGSATILGGGDSPWGVAVGNGHIYWTDSNDGTIKEAPLTGGPATTLVTGQDNPEGLAVDSGHIYWANSDLGGTINEAPLTGGPATTLVTGQDEPVGVAVSP